jgi:hypothetical protein
MFRIVDRTGVHTVHHFNSQHELLYIKQKDRRPKCLEQKKKKEEDDEENLACSISLCSLINFLILVIFFRKPTNAPTMAGLVGLIKSKPKPVINDVSNNPYSMAMQLPEPSERIFDGELKLLLMDGLAKAHTFFLYHARLCTPSICSILTCCRFDTRLRYQKR